MPKLGRYVFGAAAIALGVVGLVWHDFNPPWQPMPDEVPGREVLAYASGALYVLAGLALLWPRTAALGAVVMTLLSLVFTAMWARRIIGHPDIFAVYSGTAEQLALVAAGVTVIAMAQPGQAWSKPALLACRIVFGVCLVLFALAHFLYPRETQAMTPTWLPPSTAFWALATGGAHLAAGLALISGILALPAARLLTAMFVAFGVLVWLPQLMSAQTHMNWGGNAINLALIGAAWVIADAVAASKQRSEVLA